MITTERVAVFVVAAILMISLFVIFQPSTFSNNLLPQKVDEETNSYPKETDLNMLEQNYTRLLQEQGEYQKKIEDAIKKMELLSQDIVQLDQNTKNLNEKVQKVEKITDDIKNIVDVATKESSGKDSNLEEILSRLDNVEELIQKLENQKVENVESFILPDEKTLSKNMKSQFGEDEYVFNNFFKDPLKTHGFFLEVGALDGVKFSNTFFYENILKWDGILIEATPTTAEKMMKNRSASYKFNGAVCSSPKTITIVTSGNNAVDGNPEFMSEDFQQQFHKNINKERKYEVQCNTLTYYIGQSGRNHIDFMIVDIEGGEYDAFLGFDWDNITVGVWAVEISEPELEKNKLLKQMLVDHGYEYRYRLKLSEIWVNTELFGDN